MDLGGANASQRNEVQPEKGPNEEIANSRYGPRPNEDSGEEEESLQLGIHHRDETRIRPRPISAGTDRIMLTSRRTKKHVTIQEDSVQHSGEIDVGTAVDKLENDFSNGIKEIRNCLMSVASEKQSFDLHIKSLEESLRKVTEENEKYRKLMQQMKEDIEIRTAKLEAMKEENESLQSDHESHLNSIADHHRKKLIAKRTFRKWRERLKNDTPGRQIAELINENQRLKKELQLYEESAKHAFLRSANVLNSEALTLFQNTATRRLNTLSQDEISNVDSVRGSESSTTGQSSDADQSSNSTIDSYSGAEKENLDQPRNRKEPRKRTSYLREGSKRTYEYLSDDQQRRTRRDTSAPSGAVSDGELGKNTTTDYRTKRPVREFLPDHLRHETRQIMSQLQMNRSRNFDRISTETKGEKNNGDQPHTIQHVHICHCTTLPGVPSTCSYCLPQEKYNCQNLPFSSSSKPKPKPRREPCKRDSRRVFEEVAGDKAKVIYKPSGSTVVIQKHL